MSTKIKVTKKISPKDKSKIKTTVTDTVSARTENDKLTTSRKRNVSNNKKHK